MYRHLLNWLDELRKRQTDIAAVDVREGTLHRVLTAPFNKMEPSLSPDGRWLAYSSDESERYEVYLQPFPALDGRWQVSTAGGGQPMWSRDGRRLFYRGSGKMMAVDVKLNPFDPSPPRALFDDKFASTQNFEHTCYDVMPDGRMFLMVTRAAGTGRATTHLNFVLDWFRSVKR